jgi:cytochrome c-type biogenesis protein CcmH
MRITPGKPGPAFFLGLAYVDSGEFAGAKPAWEHALAVAPANAPYRADIHDRLGLIDMFLAMEAKQPAAK